MSGRGRAIPVSVGWGVGLATVAAGISGVSVFVNGFAVRQLPDPAVYTTLKNGIAAVLVLALAAATVRPADVRTIGRRSWAWLAVIGVVGGSVPFVLFFTGLAQASAPSAAFIQKTLFVWVAILAVPILGERLGRAQVLALGVLVAGQVLVLNPANVRWGGGETMIAGATLLWAVETILARRMLATVPSAVVAAARLGIGLVVLVAFLGLTGRLPIVGRLAPEAWGWAIVTGLFLAGYVATWFGALRRAPASLVTAVLVAGAPVTAALQGLASGGLPATPALAGHVLILTGALVLGATGILVRGAMAEPAPAPATTATAAAPGDA